MKNALGFGSRGNDRETLEVEVVHIILKLKFRTLCLAILLENRQQTILYILGEFVCLIQKYGNILILNVRDNDVVEKLLDPANRTSINLNEFLFKTLPDLPSEHRLAATSRCGNEKVRQKANLLINVNMTR